MAATDVTLLSLNINDGTSFITSDFDDSAPWERAINMFTLARAAGATITNDEFTTKPFRITGLIQGTSITNLENNIDAFNAAMSVKQGNLDTTYAGVTRRYSGNVESFSVSRPVRAAKWAKFEITFRALQYGQATTPVTLVNAVTVGSTTPIDIDMDGTAPEQYPILTYVLGSGISATAELQLSNPSTGEVLRVTTGTWASGQTVVVDFFAQQVTVNGTVVDYTGAFPSYTHAQNQTLLLDFNSATITFFQATSPSYTIPAGVYYMDLYCRGGAGGGGGRASAGAAGGGGGGAYAQKLNVSVTPGASYAVSVVTGAVAGGTGAADGTDGADSSFGSPVIVKAAGGKGGKTTGAGGAGGLAANCVGDIIFAGGNGGAGASGTNVGGGGGGGAAGSTSAGGNATAGSGSTAGSGGAAGTGNDLGAGATFGGAPGGSDANGVSVGSSSGQTAAAGGGAGTSGTSRNGGNGRGGKVGGRYKSFGGTLTVVYTPRYL